ncbi:MAG: ribosome assembly cofactor RimP [Bacteroidia bacterium]|nr:MAG: ribosome assembly cofactor RimP [Bacteroidia bacterium]
MINIDKIRDIVTQFVKDRDLFIVDIKADNANRVLIVIDSDTKVSISDCVSLSRNIEKEFDREEEDFELEVSSAGITSPLLQERQYQKNIGNQLEILTQEGQKLKVVLESVNKEGIVVTKKHFIKEEGRKKKKLVLLEEKIPFDKIKTAKLLLSFK